MKDSKKLLLVKHNEGSYVMFLPTDLTSIRELRSALKNSLLENSFSNKAVIDIELAADEALTNSISANVISGSNEMIICRWKIKDHKFTMWIMDYGSGLRSPKPESFPVDIRVTNLDEYLNRVKQHQEKKCETLPLKGVRIPHRNVGRGLQIIQSLMDTFKITYHCGGGRISSDPDERNIQGSIIELGFDSSKHLV
ncbi:ATP-binding protein [Leptospira borgpetersenii]|uniref:ATP-binding protein n=1 Tax=Leptospira borgpetersenii TaxID=174 RepID=UPI000773AF5C|nr:ATP-binding protein [Leptospira borgpetersenii]MBE8363845.1 ATP-binding protein [Leptospira borgpetersenii serovar Balcanica]MBE8368088.1 ATP-binding protein [Leptospira borgpetersenii serovar Balcanica]MBE8422865.1 ATP-binding protein [Leptospira borgpetersenii serovar Balcanica]MBF3349152.1 ATP-binding protein [Leptospira borgpetersenii serovar Balcanica]MBF3375870.1 ATP-binding protein [Leptospira borgpetersenii serovar Balcanica]